MLMLMQTAKSTLLSTLLALLCSCLLAACGLKGPLYLPTDETVAKPGTAQSTETAEEEIDKEEYDCDS